MKQKTPVAQTSMVCFCVIVLFATLLLSTLPAYADYEIYDSLVRLHILAHSDAQEDQELKLQVRDAVLQSMEDLTRECTNAEEALTVLRANTDEIAAQAQATIYEQGALYPVSVTIDEEYYPTRTYEGFALPAGVYHSVRISIGEAAGKNWWCVIFPALCVNTAAAEPTMTQVGFSSDQIRILTGDENPRYVLRFKILEFFGELTSLFS